MHFKNLIELFDRKLQNHLWKSCHYISTYITYVPTKYKLICLTRSLYCLSVTLRVIYFMKNWTIFLPLSHLLQHHRVPMLKIGTYYSTVLGEIYREFQWQSFIYILYLLMLCMYGRCKIIFVKKCPQHLIMYCNGRIRQ